MAPLPLHLSFLPPFIFPDSSWISALLSHTHIGLYLKLIQLPPNRLAVPDIWRALFFYAANSSSIHTVPKLPLTHMTWHSLTKTMGPVQCPETPAWNYYPTICNSPEERRFHSHHMWSLKSRKKWLVYPSVFGNLPHKPETLCNV